MVVFPIFPMFSLEIKKERDAPIIYIVQESCEIFMRKVSSGFRVSHLFLVGLLIVVGMVSIGGVSVAPGSYISGLNIPSIVRCTKMGMSRLIPKLPPSAECGVKVRFRLSRDILTHRTRWLRRG